jgi:hypothetical protein
LNARRRALRALPSPDAEAAEIVEAMREFSNGDDLGLDAQDRQAIVARLGASLESRQPLGDSTASFSTPGSAFWPGTITTAGTAPATVVFELPASRSALTDLLDIGVESTAGENGADEVVDLLAESAGLDPAEVETILEGEGNPSRDDLIAIADVLGLDGEEVIAAAESDGATFNGEDDDAETAAALEAAERLRESVAAFADKVRPT